MQARKSREKLAKLGPNTFVDLRAKIAEKDQRMVVRKAPTIGYC
tara:strand:- start:301 stop:432 length:132 start_codon:yes stop_codon:yes gene_type:complete